MAGIRTPLSAGQALLTTFLVMGATPAAATGQITCQTFGGKEAALSYTVGSVPVLAVVGAQIDALGQSWAINPQAGETAVIVGQASEDGGHTVIDFVDPNVEQVLVSVRLHHAAEGGTSARAGTLHAPGLGAVAIACEGP